MEHRFCAFCCEGNKNMEYKQYKGVMVCRDCLADFKTVNYEPFDVFGKESNLLDFYDKKDALYMEDLKLGKGYKYE